MDLAVLRIDDVLGDVAAVELLLVDELLLDALLTHPLQDARRDLGAELDDDLAGARVLEVAAQLDAAQALGIEPGRPTGIAQREHHTIVQLREDLLRGHARPFGRRQHRLRIGGTQPPTPPPRPPPVARHPPPPPPTPPP